MVRTVNDHMSIYSRSAILAAALAVMLGMAATRADAQTAASPDSTGGPTNLLQDPQAAEPVTPSPELRQEQQPALQKSDLKGAKVVSVDDKIAGEVDDVVDQHGSKVAIVEFGGILGFGKTKVAIPVTELALVRAGVAVVPMTEEQVKNLPEYKG